MKIKKIKCLTTFMALSMMLGSMSGCGSKAADSSSANGSKHVELTVEVFDRGVQGNAPVDNNYLTKWINEQFGKPNNIDVKFIPVNRADETNKLSILMASNEAPDVCTTNVSSVVVNFVTQGGIAELDSAIDKNGAQIKSYIGDEVLKYGKIGGKQYYIPGKRIFTGIVQNSIRKDWLDKLGLPVPNTTDQLYTTLKQFKEKDPGQIGNKLIPFDMSAANMQMGDYNIVYSFMKPMSDQDRYATPLMAKPGVKDAYKFMNKLYNEGLINKEFALDKDSKKLNSNIANGYSGFYIANIGDTYAISPEVVSTLVKNIPTAKMVACDPFSNAEGKHPKLENGPTGLTNFVPKSSKHVTEAVKYLNWMCDPKVLMTLQNGIEGTQYEMKDGLPTPKTGNDYEKVSNGDYVLTANGKELGDFNKTIKAQSLAYPGFEDVYNDAVKISLTDGVKNIVVNEPNTVQSKYKGVLDGKSLDMKIKVITCKPEEFDKLYDQLLQDYMSSGGKETMDEAVKLYQKEYKK